MNDVDSVLKLVWADARMTNWASIAMVRRQGRLQRPWHSWYVFMQLCDVCRAVKLEVHPQSSDIQEKMSRVGQASCAARVIALPQRKRLLIYTVIYNMLSL